MLDSPGVHRCHRAAGRKGLDREKVSAESKVPVIKHLDGNCHVFIDSDAEIDKSDRSLLQRKVSPLRSMRAMENASAGSSYRGKGAWSA